METSEINKAIGRKIALLLEINKMSQSELARIVGYSNHTAISQIVGGTKGPGKAMMKKIAKALHIPEPFLSSGDEYDREELEAMIKIKSLIDKKDENPEEYQLMLAFLKRL